MRWRPAFAAGLAVALLAIVVVVAAAVDPDVVGSGRHVGSGVAASEPRPLPSFTAVDVTGSNVVTVLVGAPQRVVVHADDNLLRRVTTAVRQERLSIGSRGSFESSAPMRVDVSVPALTSVTLSGSGTVRVDGIGADTFSVELPGSGTIELTGTTARLTATIGGSGAIRAVGLAAGGVVARISGTGSIQVTVTDALDATIDGTGSIVYAGEPSHVARSITGTGSIEPS
jgi:hypothetical protein